VSGKINIVNFNKIFKIRWETNSLGVIFAQRINFPTDFYHFLPRVEYRKFD